MKYVYLILILSLPILFSGCKKNKMPFGVLTLETDQITSISAVCSGSVEINPKAPITQVGICWSKSSNPTINENSSIANVLSGTFNIELKNLEVGATYYYRAYAINKNGVSYGDQKNFSTSNDPTNLPKFIRGFNIDIGITQIRLKCNFVQGYNLTIIEKGICWSTNQTANLDTKIQTKLF